MIAGGLLGIDLKMNTCGEVVVEAELGRGTSQALMQTPPPGGEASAPSQEPWSWNNSSQLYQTGARRPLYSHTDQALEVGWLWEGD